jgi:hypothetical protein
MKPPKPHRNNNHEILLGPDRSIHTPLSPVKRINNPMQTISHFSKQDLSLIALSVLENRCSTLTDAHGASRS